MVKPGDLIMAGGDVTKLARIGARTGAALEDELGFQRGRLRQGYFVLVLKQTLKKADFEFAGITLRSGGREGNPAATKAADDLRMHVSQRMREEYGVATYESMQEKALEGITATGPNRLVKFWPVIRNDLGLAPNVQYPPGGGGLQWTLVNDCKFLVAVEVTSGGIAKAQGVSWRTGPGSSYDDAHRINAYLERI